MGDGIRLVVLRYTNIRGKNHGCSKSGSRQFWDGFQEGNPLASHTLLRMLEQPSQSLVY